MSIVKRPDSQAVLKSYLLDGKSNGTVIICPGGGYIALSPRESEPVAKAFNEHGYSAFVLDYTVCSADGEPALGTKPLSDIAWAVAHVRENASGYKLDPDKIAVCGFSAGGHLAASIGVHWDKPEFFGGDKEAVIYKPNAIILSYAVLNRHARSFRRLAGEDSAAQAPYMLENFVSANTPPTFLWHTAADDNVPVMNSMAFAQRLDANRIPFEMHIFPFGRHGLSLATPEVDDPEKGPSSDPHTAQWMRLCAEWLDITFKNTGSIEG